MLLLHFQQFCPYIHSLKRSGFTDRLDKRKQESKGIRSWKYDSFFSWNFFDEVLFRNEYFSPYIFEETAEKLLKENPELRREFERKLKEDPEFAGNAYGQLRFIYERSPWSEPTYMRYPVYRSVN